TVHSTDEVERLLHLPALAVIPAVGGTTRRRFLSSTKALQKRNGSSSSNPELLINIDGRSPLAESYRQLRTSILLSTAGRAPKTSDSRCKGQQRRISTLRSANIMPICITTRRSTTCY